ncbi:neuropeptide [Lithospermum erythrorhizon]|uniref:Neuropeptide n=1 Tax=Lithospermum erythrorhizon TaxID=34254 RepID=A0AAV3P136_LITER
MTKEAEHEEDEAAGNLLRDRFRLSTISIAEFEAKQFDMELSQPIVSCISDLAFKYAEILAKDLAVFARHGARKSVNMEDVILSVHRNEHLASTMRSFRNDLKAKEPKSEKKRRKKAKTDNLFAADVPEVPDLSNFERKKKKKAKEDNLLATDVLDVPDP